MAANSVGPNVAAAAANIIGLAPNGLTHDAGLLECGVCTLPAFGASAPYAPSAAHVPVAGNKRMAEWQPECIARRAAWLLRFLGKRDDSAGTIGGVFYDVEPLGDIEKGENNQETTLPPRVRR